MDVFGELQEAVKKEIYVSEFDFGSREIEKEDIEFIKNSEQKLRKRFMGISESLYDICIILNQVSLKFKKSGDFMDWYEANGLTKDNISEFNKRFILFQEFSDKKDFISSLSTQSVKFLTHKDVTADAREKIIDGGIKKAETIKELLAPVRDRIAIEFKERTKSYVNYKKLEKMKTRITKVEDGNELNSLKADIDALAICLKDMKQAVKKKEKEWEHKNNLTFDDVKFNKLYNDVMNELEVYKSKGEGAMVDTDIDLKNDWWRSRVYDLFHDMEIFDRSDWFKFEERFLN
ncbi:MULTISPECIES: hypothetical protein [Psychrilyobacter]|uniref:Uncharacterized protein n=1 Tax=Psychrilyobacter piezotolerans TaxID=2293438 RepID=A0ABX9KJQ0_9FUSO|nr:MULTISPECIES: hypothetical protein [Psychrilyobacter]MCS5421890.1 hypothetical protein [Psychrilyobacter sp. S5]NDI76955.1 hypothetical protein [Psychrilyobacter piezotolerans]RDE64577.1 hypothetical protein DV867_03285 [Psychrilyobacter sp. S5]REI42389.1 hypothetical protein DYH56_03285 [Psychrilyobacter piezotolerans]